MTSKMKTTSKMSTTLKMKTTLKIGLPTQIILPPLPLKSYLKFFLMTSHLDCHTTTDVKLDMLSGVQTGNGIPHDRYNVRGIAHARTNRKDKSLHVYWSGAKELIKNQDLTLPELTQP